MVNFLLNGKVCSIGEEESLISFLRDTEDLISVKNGCGEGACGACMILVDGRATKACILRGEKVKDKKIITVEGLDENYKRAFAYSFRKAGAVQCGFCIPGMVISATGLFNKTLTPTLEDVKKALIGNICRCTGYKKIEEAILMAAEIIRDNKDIPLVKCKGLVGDSLGRVDAEDKVLALDGYCDDLKIDGMLYGVALRPEYPRILIKNIDYSEALNLKGVVKVVTAADVPGNRFCGHLKKDWPALIAIGEETRYVGDTIALVVAESEDIARKAINLIKIDYDKLTPMTCPEDSLKVGAPEIHKGGNILTREVLKRGNVDEAIKNSKYVVTNNYSMPFTEHAFLEPESALAVPTDEELVVYTGTQSVYDDLHEIASLLGVEESKVRIISKYVGGGFGGKEDMSCQHQAALLAFLTGKPVKMTLKRSESIKVHPKRHAMKMEFTTACDENGKLTAMKAKIIADTGAYASLGGPVLQRACTHAAGPYNYQNSEVEGIAVYTNNPPGGAFRGFGVTQSAFANESNINKLAELVGISPWEIRFRNAIEPGQELPNGQIADAGTALKETLLAVKDEYEKNEFVGIACAFKNAGIGVGLPDIGRTMLEVKDEIVLIKTSAACMGQGIGTTMTQIVCETLDLDTSKVKWIKPDTKLTPNSGTSTASRQTLFTGEATRVAALKLKEALKIKTLKELNGKEFYGEFYGKTDKMGSDKKNPVSHIAYGFATQLVILNKEGQVKKIVAAHDVGRAINPLNVEGQIEGGVVMGLGYALTEDYPLKESIPTAKFGTLGLFRSTMVPEIESIIIEKNNSELAYGAKGVGEITCIPTAPAVQGAYYKLDGVFRTKLPLENTFYKKAKK